MPNSFGHIYRITTFGESHGGAVGVVIDGCPPGYPIDLGQVQEWLNRRRPGQSKLSSPRKEADLVECVSGLEQGISLGTPIALLVRNEDQKPQHYEDLTQVWRPSHADFTTWAKYGVRPQSGGGRASARETIGRVAGAAIAQQILTQNLEDFSCVAWVDSVKGVRPKIDDYRTFSRKELDEHPLRAPLTKDRDQLEALILNAQKAGDTVGGTIACSIRGVPTGLGDPVFDKLEADLAKAMMSLPASKGFEIGLGFSSTELYGSEHNDLFAMKDGKISTLTNRSGGIQGGISNGEEIYFRVAFKPIATIFKEQQTINAEGETITLKPKMGRHDPCVLPRAVPMVEAMAVLVIMDHWLRQKVIEATRKLEP